MLALIGIGERGEDRQHTDQDIAPLKNLVSLTSLNLRDTLVEDNRASGASSVLMESPGDSSEARFVIPFRR
jgi:hypothetical protein